MVRVMTVSEVAELLRISEPLVYKAARAGDIPSFKVGNRVLFNAEKIEAIVTGEEDHDADEPKQNSNRHRVYGTIRNRRIASARMV